MSIARHHHEWISFLDISGPFLSLQELLRVFPQGLDAHDPEISRALRAGYEQWVQEKAHAHPDPAIHAAWVKLVLERALGLEGEFLAQGQAIPEALKWMTPQTGETLRPTFIVPSAETSPPAPLLQGEGSRAQMLIHVFPPQQALDKPLLNSRSHDSVKTRLMEILRATGVNLALATNGEEWVLVTSPDISGGTTGYISWYAYLWFEENVTLRAFRSLLGVARFFSVAEENTLAAMARASADDQYELTDQLGKQVRHAVEVLVRAVDRENQNRHDLLDGITEAELYEAAVTVMMRLVFMFAAEERDLFALTNPLYAENYAVSTLRAELRETGDRYGEELLERRHDAWCRLLAAFRVVYGGVEYPDMQVRAYGGSLFDPDRFPFLEGRTRATTWREMQAAPLPITNRDVLYILESLQILRVKLPGGGPAEARRLSFRALDIEQIGDIYQTLLDHTAVRARETVLGLVGTKDKEPELALAALEAKRAQGEDALVEFLRDETGKSANALKNALRAETIDEAFQDVTYVSHLRSACGNDAALLARVRPFSQLVRNDDFGAPVILLPDSVFVTAGMSRRQTQSHYTPRVLTEPLVRHTLEPLVYVGPAEGLAQTEWKLKPARELLQLKICDMAMGSASILVQAVRYLGDRLVEAWEKAEKDERIASDSSGRMKDEHSVLSPHPSVLRITPEGEVSRGAANEELIPLDADERVLYARRIVTDRCIYGVDKNPLAVELAKLSLWLVTMDKQRAFTFLDHALKCGDSLVGADEDMFLRWTHSNKSSAMPLFDEQLRAQLETARAKRRELAAFDVRDVRDGERKQHLLDEANEALRNIKLGCDIVVGARLLKLKDKEREQLLNRALLDFVAGKPLEDEGTRQAYGAARKVRAFHWFAEFPEVFERGGFDAFVGNPPFLGGQKISGTLGENYLDYLKEKWSHTRGSADLCAYFFLRAFENVQHDGTFGLLGTNTIAQGDTREVGLEHIAKQGGIVYRARPNVPWPGEAAVSVSIVHIARGHYQGAKFLDEVIVPFISPLLDITSILTNPKTLLANARKSFQGSIVLGLGFTLQPDEAENLIARNPNNRNILFPYLIAEDFNSRYDQSPSRWVINFSDFSLEDASQYPDCLEIVAEKVYPERQKLTGENSVNKRRREYWWQYGALAKMLYQTIRPMERVLVCPIVTKFVSFAFTPSNWVFAHRVCVFAFDTFDYFSLLQSSIHEIWARKYSSTLETRINYSSTDVFETFPFPISNPSQLFGTSLQSLDAIGETYHEHRRQLMLARQEGLTATYNRFHNPKEKSADIQRLRDLHVEMDHAVAAAYGWTDLDLGHGFHETAQGIRFTLSEEARREVLARLLRLNHERWEEEQRERGREGERERGSGKGKKKKSVKEAGMEYNARLFE